jgi:chromosome segregation ATPase
LIEIQAGSDQLRADFAISTCRLEKSVEQLKVKAARQLSEIGRQTQTINRLTAELERRTSVVEELVNKVESLTGKIAEVERERDRIAMEVISLECALSAKEWDWYDRRATRGLRSTTTTRASGSASPSFR